MRLLCVCYMLPPALYPQAIQVGRLLAGLPVEMGIVSGEVDQFGTGLDSYMNFAGRLAFRASVEFRPRVNEAVARLARRFLPFYGHVPDEFRGWISLAEQAAENAMTAHEFRPDVMVTFGVPMSDHLVGFRLKAKFGMPWIAHFSDPWVDNAFHRQKVLANIVNRRLERQVISKADQLVFTSSETLDLVMGKYPLDWRAKAIVLPHSYDPVLYSSPVRNPGGPVLRHLGNFYGHRSPIPLFRALRAILDHDARLLDNVRVELVGQLPRRMRLHPALRSLPAELVRLVDTVPYSQSLRMMSDADLLLVIDAPDDLSVFLPSKLIDYVGSGTPIFGIVPPGTSAKLLGRLGGLVANPRKPAEVIDRLRQALHFVRARRAASDRVEWGMVDVRAEYHVDRVRHAFLESLRAVNRGPSLSSCRI